MSLFGVFFFFFRRMLFISIGGTSDKKQQQQKIDERNLTTWNIIIYDGCIFLFCLPAVTTDEWSEFTIVNFEKKFINFFSCNSDEDMRQMIIKFTLLVRKSLTKWKRWEMCWVFFAKVPYFTAFQLSDINECLSNPCHNGATCVDLIGNYRCNCKAGYTGGNCETGSNFLIEQLISIRFADSSIVYVSSQYYFLAFTFTPTFMIQNWTKLTMTSPSKHKICQAPNNPTSGTNIYLLASINRTLQLLAPFFTL